MPRRPVSDSINDVSGSSLRDSDSVKNASSATTVNAVVNHATNSTANSDATLVQSLPFPPAHEGAHIVNENTANDCIQLELVGTFAQRVDFGVHGSGTLTIDEPIPLGENTGPSPTRVLAAALASCLGASLLFCLKRARIDVLGLNTQASVALKRNERKRLRIDSITVQLNPIVPLEQHSRMTACLATFEDYCVVTASVRPGITVNVSVNTLAPATGNAAVGENSGETGTDPNVTSATPVETEPDATVSE